MINSQGSRWLFALSAIDRIVFVGDNRDENNFIKI